MQVEITTVESAAADGHTLAPGPAVRQARFRLVQDLKLAQGVQALRTATTPEVCGLTLIPGGRYWIFASRHPGQAVAWADACGGSRQIGQAFVDTAAERVEPLLSQLAAALVCPAPTPAEIAGRWRLESLPRTGAAEPAATTLLSPNRAYSVSDRSTPPLPGQPQVAKLVFDSQGRQLGALWLHGVASPVHTEWINEKLVFVRVRWHDGLRSDLVLDVETPQILSAETARRQADGTRDWLAGDCRPAPVR